MIKKYNLKENIWQTSLISFGVTTAILIILFVTMGFAPFGGKALTWADAEIQYLDFFGYFKDVLEGKNDIGYSFSKMLGGSGIAILSYYLASPFNLLIVFFEKENLHSFFHLLLLLKLALSSATFSYFLNKRFECKNKLFTIALSVGYGLSQYSIAQSSNIMWLDGVYMLPLILESVYELVNKNITWKLSVTVGISILINWYTGGINCLFSIFWYFFEVALRQCDVTERTIKERILDCIKSLWNYGMAMALGVILSAVLFLPTIGALQSSDKGSLSLEMLLDFSFTGNILSSIQGYSLGAQSQYGSVSLFCGSFAILGSIACFFSKEIKVSKKFVMGGMALIILLMFYWRPLFVLFSLLKSADSYWYRYSYCGIVVLLFLCATFLFTTNYEKKPFFLSKIAVLFSGILLFLNFLNFEKDFQKIYQTVEFAIFVSAAIGLYIYACKKNKYKLFASIFFMLAIIAETLYSAGYQMEYYQTSRVDEYREYVEKTEEQIEELKKYDKGIYRISQTSTRIPQSNNLTANYNESLPYNYWSISGYSSVPDDVSQNFIERAGYKIEADCISIVNTSILPVDSLMGVKYILSKYPISGLEEVQELGVYNEKTVYNNPYCLPMAFTYEKNEFEYEDVGENPFLYQNELYSKLTGEEQQLFIPLEYEVVKNGNVEEGIAQTYKLFIPDGRFAFYGNIPTESQMNALLDVNQIYQTGYSCWTAPDVFYIPVESGVDEVAITLKSDTLYDITKKAEQFYALDLELLEKLSSELSAHKADKIQIENGCAYFEKKASKNQNMYISIPYNEGWNIELNGQSIEASLFGDCFYSIPLEEGKNIIKMQYEVKYLKEGFVISVLGLIAVVFIMKRQGRKNGLSQLYNHTPEN